MPGTGSSHHRAGKSSKKGASGTHHDVPGKKKSSKSRDLSPECSTRKHADVGNVRAASRKAKPESDIRRETSSSRAPEREPAPIRNIMKRSAEKQSGTPKDPKPKPSPAPRPAPSRQMDLEDARTKAAEAAMSRLDQSIKSVGFVKDSPSKASSDQLAVQSVLYICPVVSQEILHSRDWRPKIITYLAQLSRTEKEIAAVLTIHTLNSKEKVDECVQILMTYLKNIVTNPEEDKYRTIKLMNKVFSEKVLPNKGAVDLLEAAGFTKREKPDDVGARMDVLYLEGDPDMEKLLMLIDCLKSAEPVLPRVYRDPMILKPKEAEERVYLPEDFYDLTEKELTEMYKKNLQKIEDESPLMTKAMREKEERRHLAKYKYTVLRVRFPDSVILQGTFSRLDTQMCVKEFVNSCLVKPFKYSLFCPVTKSVLVEMNDNKTLMDLKLIPSVILNFIPDDKDKLPNVYLKPELTKKIKKI